MTALAMIIGMLPMAFALGEGGEQNAPLGRAVIGGLLVATVATLFFVPTVFSVLHTRRERAAHAQAGGPAARTERLTRRTNGREKTHQLRTTRIAAAAALVARPAPDRASRPLVAAVVIAVLGILERRSHESEVSAMDRRTGDSDRRRHHAAARRRQASVGAARHHPGMVRGADLCARQRLSEGLVFRLRRSCEERRRPRRDRRSGPRCAIGGGAGQAQLGASGGQSQGGRKAIRRIDLRALARFAQGRRLGAGAGEQAGRLQQRARAAQRRHAPTSTPTRARSIACRRWKASRKSSRHSTAS